MLKILTNIFKKFKSTKSQNTIKDQYSVGLIVHIEDIDEFERNLKSLNFEYEIHDKCNNVSCPSYEKIFRIFKSNLTSKEEFMTYLEKIKPTYFDCKI